MARRRVALTDIGGDRDTICTKPFLDAADGLRATLGTKSTELDFLFKQVRENTDGLTVAESLWSEGPQIARYPRSTSKGPSHAG